MPRLQDVVPHARQDATPTRCHGARTARCLAYKMSWQTRGKMPRLRSELVSAEQGARLQDAAAHAEQDATPTGRGAARTARCHAYKMPQRTRGKIPRLQDVAARAGQDAPPTGRGAARAARCRAYKMPWRARGKMPRLQDGTAHAGRTRLDNATFT